MLASMHKGGGGGGGGECNPTFYSKNLIIEKIGQGLVKPKGRKIVNLAS